MFHVFQNENENICFCKHILNYKFLKVRTDKRFLYQYNRMANCGKYNSMVWYFSFLHCKILITRSYFIYIKKRW